MEPHLGLVSKNTEILKGSYVKFGGAPVPHVLLDVQVAAVARSAISPALADLWAVTLRWKGSYDHYTHPSYILAQLLKSAVYGAAHGHSMELN